MAKIELYPRQKVFQEAILKSMSKGSRHIICSASPAFGKSFVIASIASRAAKKGSVCLLLTHRLKILSQNNGALKAFDADSIVINEEKKGMLPKGFLYSSSAQTIKARWNDDDDIIELIKKADIILLDECHVQIYNFLFESGLVDNTWVLGFTGTSNRSGNQRQLGLDYVDIVETMKKSELVAQGYLPRCKYYEVPINLSKVVKDKEKGDYQAKSAYQTFDSPTLYRGLIDNYKKYGEGKQFVCFCANISHAIKTCVEMNKSGLKTKFVVSTVNKPIEPEDKNSGEYVRYLDRLETYELMQKYQYLQSTPDVINKELESNSIIGVVTIEILSTGWSYDPLTVLLMNKCTMSSSLWRQIGGRIERLHKDKPYGIVIDMGDNVRRLGQFDSDIEPSLWHEQSDSVGMPNCKVCGEKGVDKNGNKGCSRLILSSYSICPICGHVFKTEREELEIKLQERLQEEPKTFKEMSVDGLLAYASLNGYKKAWIWRQLWNRAETEKQFRDDMRYLGYKNPFIYRMQQQYKLN